MKLFRISIFLKAFDGIIEVCAGIFFYFVGYTKINKVLFSIFHGEITETPRDPFWQFLINEWHSISLSGHAFWGILFMAHGATKLFLSVALLKDTLWAYPTAIVVFTIFALFEIYSLFIQPSLFLWLITLFDILVIGLIFRQYRIDIKNSLPSSARSH